MILLVLAALSAGCAANEEDAPLAVDVVTFDGRDSSNITFTLRLTNHADVPLTIVASQAQLDVTSSSGGLRDRAMTISPFTGYNEMLPRDTTLAEGEARELNFTATIRNDTASRAPAHEMHTGDVFELNVNLEYRSADVHYSHGINVGCFDMTGTRINAHVGCENQNPIHARAITP